MDMKQKRHLTMLANEPQRLQSFGHVNTWSSMTTHVPDHWGNRRAHCPTISPVSCSPTETVDKSYERFPDSGIQTSSQIHCCWDDQRC